MSTTTEREFLGEEVPRGATASGTRTDGRDSQDQGNQDHAHVHTHVHTHDGPESEPLCTGHGCVQTPPKP